MFSPDGMACSLGIYGGESTCIAADTRSDCLLAAVEGKPCAPSLPSITIVGHPNATEFADQAYAGYGGILKISGRFPLVTRIGTFAFYCAGEFPMNVDSELIFDRDAFPVLVEISTSAFVHAKNIQFKNQPFPALQSIGFHAFHRCSSTSIVELINQQELELVGQGAFSDFEGFASFHFSLYRGTKVKQAVVLKDLPLLKRISSEAFYNFGGNITIEGVFPALEVIGAEAFRTLDSLHISINIPFGLPALQCMGPRAFALTDWQGRLAIKGDFPCLQSAAPEETDTDDDTGDYSAYNVGEKVFKQSSLFSPLTIAKYNFRVKMNVNGCKPGAIDWCTETKAVCNTIHGFASKAKCFADDSSTDNFIPNKMDDIPMNPPNNNADNDACQQDCRLGLVSKDSLGCMQSFDVHDNLCAGKLGDACSTLFTGNNRIQIVSRNDVVGIVMWAFSKFPGVLTMEGRFPRLTRIGRYAFADVGIAAAATTTFRTSSYLHFGRDAFPVLTEIGYGAFRNFYGSIRFVDSPFPKLQYIDETAFRYEYEYYKDNVERMEAHEDALSNRFVDLRNHQMLSAIDRKAFYNFGRVLLSGSLPNLKYVGYSAFSSPDRVQAGATNETYVQLVDLPRLQTIADKAFRDTAGPVELRGTFPNLEHIGFQAFGHVDTANKVTITLEGGPALRCVDNEAFAGAVSSRLRSGGLSMRGDYPCLKLDVADSPIPFTSDDNRDLISVDVRLQTCYMNRIAYVHTSIDQLINCSNSKNECTARRGDDQYARCLSSIDYHQTYSGYAEFTPPPKNCSIGVGMNQKTSCITEEDEQSLYCTSPKTAGSGGCGSISNAPALEIRGRDDATAFHDSGFLDYGSNIQISGTFNRLERVGSLAFRRAGTPDSIIEFVTGDLPVLVEIGMMAFQGFKGTVRFLGSPFPKLQTLQRNAFQSVAGLSSRVELKDHQHLANIMGGAFQDFPSVTLRGSLPRLEIVGRGAFQREELECFKESVVELTNLPALRMIDDRAFFAFCGKQLVVKGAFPSLEVIGEKAMFTDIKWSNTPMVWLDKGAPALRCIGKHAFKDEKLKLVLAGSFPCLRLGTSQQEWNNPETWWWKNGTTNLGRSNEYYYNGSKVIRIDVGLHGDCTQFLSKDECYTLNKDGTSMCESMSGDHRFTACDVVADAANIDDASFAESSCSLGMLSMFDGRVGCHSYDADGSPILPDCASQKNAKMECLNVTTEITIGTNDAITNIANVGFYKYSGTLHMQGYFRRLRVIGVGAFQQAGSLDYQSSIIFGKGSLPMLVEIGAQAFDSFRGVVRIVSDAFPQLQYIPRDSFQYSEFALSIGGGAYGETLKSRIELVDQLHLVKIHQKAFHRFPGTLLMKGNFPKLVGVAQHAFSKAGNPNSHVELTNLPRLQLIGQRAFNAFAGTVQMSGCFPLLRELQEKAFGEVSNLTFAVPHGAPGLACIGDNPFEQQQALGGTHPRPTHIEFAGSFPCLDFSGNRENLHFNKPYLGLYFSTEFKISQGCKDLREGNGYTVERELWCKESLSKCNSEFAIPESGAIKCDIGMQDLKTDFTKLDGSSGPDYSQTTRATAITGNTSVMQLPHTPNDATNKTYYGGNTGPTGGGAGTSTSNKSDKVIGGSIAGIVALFAFVLVAARYRHAVLTKRRNLVTMKKLCNATKERAQLQFLAKYSRVLFSNVQSADEYAAVVSALELPNITLKAGRTLGRGNYGEVHLATLNVNALAPAGSSPDRDGTADEGGARNHINVVVVGDRNGGNGGGNKCGSGAAIEVAVKSRLEGEVDPTVDEALLIEALVLHSLKHEHILKLVGISTASMPFLIVTEMMVNGDLKTFLRACRPTQPKPKAKLTLLDIAVIVERIAGALAYLESVSVLHRDIAARNVLVGVKATDVKLGDLGAARSVFREADREYTATSDHKPARWMAPESLKSATFSNKSDVWGFGVLCWEVTTLAKTPYGAIGIKDMVDSLNRGGRLQEAPLTPPGLYKQMKLCWSQDPKRRPRFADLVQHLGAIRGALAVTVDGTISLGWDNDLVVEGGGSINFNINQSSNATYTTFNSISKASEEVKRLGHLSVPQTATLRGEPGGGARLAVSPDGYVEDGYSGVEASIAMPQAAPRTATLRGEPGGGARLAVSPDGYVEDGYSGVEAITVAPDAVYNVFPPVELDETRL
eukprot:gene9053-11123_t